MRLRFGLVLLLAALLCSCGPVSSPSAPTLQLTVMLALTPLPTWTRLPAWTQKTPVTPREVRTDTPTPTFTSPTPTRTPPFTVPAEVNLGRIAYVQGDWVWVKDLPDGIPRQVSAERTSFLRWSPSGTWLALRRGKGLWLLEVESGESWQVPDAKGDEGFSWSPVQDRLLYRTGAGALALLDPAEGEAAPPLVLVPPTPDDLDSVVWSPDGTAIYYNEWRLVRMEGCARHGVVWRVALDGTAPRLVYDGFPSPRGSAMLRGCTGDGQYLLVQDDYCTVSAASDGVPLYSLPASGGPLLQIAGTVLPWRYNLILPAPGQTDRLAAIVGPMRDIWVSKALQVISASSGQALTLTPPEIAVANAAWSPDGQRIAYTAMPDGRGHNFDSDVNGLQLWLMQEHLWVVNLESLSAQRLTDDPNYRDENPLWSADGQYVLFTRLTVDDQASLWLIPDEGGAPREVMGEMSRLVYDWWR